MRKIIFSVFLFSIIFTLFIFLSNSVYAEQIVEQEIQTDDFLKTNYSEINLVSKIKSVVYFDDNFKIKMKQVKSTKSRLSVTYLDGGIGTEITSLNIVEKKIISKIKYHDLQSIQRIDKENDIWMTLDKSEPVLLYKQNESGTFIPIEYRVSEPIPDKITMNMDRLHSEFNDIIQYEISRATIQFDSQLIQAEIGPSFSYEYSLEGDRIDKINHVIELEKLRALEVYEKSYADSEKSD